MIIIADYTKNSTNLGEQYKKGIPIEVLPMAYVPIQKNIEKKFGGQVLLRSGVAKAGPCITDNGNFILDWLNYDQNLDWKNVNQYLINIAGVIETGLFIGMADKAYFGMADETVLERE